MPSFSDVAPSEFLRADQFRENEERTYTIQAWKPIKFKQDNGDEKAGVDLEFVETKSKLGIYNKVNREKLYELFGGGYDFDLDSLVGKRVTLYTILTEVAGKPARAIRLKAAK